MRTQLMIMAIVGSLALVALAVLAGLVLWLGWVPAAVVSLGALAVLAGSYVRVIKPWHIRWGASDAEVERPMPGDSLISGASPATRAITVAAAPEDVWPWLVQLGYGKAGWYSYDWMDNDFTPSADRIMPEHQNLAVGDRILMMPDMGFVVASVDRPRSIVSILDDGSTSWCLGLYPEGDARTRLVSRWRAKFDVTLATFFLIALSEPGTFIMEQKMLRTIRDRAEAVARHAGAERSSAQLG